jgi:hypothetical protein
VGRIFGVGVPLIVVCDQIRAEQTAVLTTSSKGFAQFQHTVTPGVQLQISSIALQLLNRVNQSKISRRLSVVVSFLVKWCSRIAGIAGFWSEEKPIQFAETTTNPIE